MSGKAFSLSANTILQTMSPRTSPAGVVRSSGRRRAVVVGAGGRGRAELRTLLLKGRPVVLPIPFSGLPFFPGWSSDAIFVLIVWYQVKGCVWSWSSVLCSVI